ncbi:MAG: hypothetical protein LBR43_04140 [Spiroplasmataceae bacterium]|nr:hypothetical protein [Spiroplasmataceae bacterium]
MNKLISQKRDRGKVEVDYIDFSFLRQKKRKTTVERRCMHCQDIFPNLNNYLDRTDPLYFRKYGWTKEYHKTCWKEIERKQAENEKKCREEQARIIANFQAKGMSAKQQAQMEQEGEMFDDEAYSYPHESNVKESELIDWKEHEATLNKEEETELIIKPNKYSFDNNELTLSDYLELKTVHAWGIDFQGVNFVNLPKLNNLYLSKVKYSIKETRLSDIENLTNLVNLTLTGINYSFFLV